LVPIPYVHMGIGGMTILVSVPLAMRVVPMNRFYGVRHRKAFASKHNWYEINAYGGRLLMLFGAFLLGFGYVSRSFAPDPTSLWAPVFLVVPLLVLIPILAMVRTFSRRLPDQ
jgi:uncharacterized membrane protein